MTPTPTTLQLWDAADQLTNPTRAPLTRDKQPTQWVTLPSLWDQLVDAIENGAGQKTGSTQQSKPPCDNTALSLLIEITTGVRDGCIDAGIRRSHNPTRDLRQIVTHVITTHDPEALTTSTALIRGWNARIRATISNDPDRTWRMHGAACRICSSTTVPVYDPDGSETRQPALIVHSEDGVIDRTECGFCGTVLTGDDLTALLLDTRRDNPAGEPRLDRLG